jgi:hypothetical protein
LAPTKFWLLQNIGSDKILALKKIFALTDFIGVAKTKYWQRQNTRINKMLAAAKYSRRQNVGIDKILMSTKCRRQQNTLVDKILGLTKCWCPQKAGTDAGGSPYYLARQTSDFSQTSLRSPTSP